MDKMVTICKSDALEQRFLTACIEGEVGLSEHFSMTEMCVCACARTHVLMCV